MLQELACGKVRVLAKTPKGREVTETDVFGINAKFENKHRRVNISVFGAKSVVWFGAA